MKQLASEALEILYSYSQILFKWNEKVNLTSYKLDEFFTIGVFDVMVLNAVLEGKNIREVADVGTGYGLPGVVLKIINPDLKVTLIDASEKKIAFLEYVSKILRLDFDIVMKKLPAQDWEKSFELIVSKASMKEKMLIKVAEKHLLKGGYLMYFHGEAPLCEYKTFPLKGKIFYKRQNKTFSNLIIREKI